MSDGNGGVSTATVTVTVTPVNDTPENLPSITGTAIEDGTLTADTTGISDADGLGTFSYQWETSSDGGSNWGAVSGATASTFTPGDVEVGSQMRVSVSYTDGNNTVETLTSTATSAVFNVNDAPTAVEISDQSATEGAIFGLNTSVAFSDVDTEDNLTYSVSELPDGLAF